MDIENQTDYWNKVSNDKEFTTRLDMSLIDKFVDKEALIVDYGCGYGRTLNELYLHGYRNLLGFDYASAMIQRGQREYPYLNLQTCQDNKIACEADSVSLVILFAVLTCIIDNDKQEELINEIIRVLKPGGMIYINDFLINSDDRNLERYRMYAGKYNTYGVFELPEGAVLRHHEESWITTLTEQFKKEHYQRITFQTMNGHTSNGFIFMGRKKG
ncbi:class I SAM-dependent methyltransferase [Microbacter margulisiae]|uniref:SAM-dependent methyltransferase n=1 Tax=Microbacter margulisiae TaxID=1350067 RepID=A0A7W5DRA9_9PORP|nr:class I SAM-dependent methyltransferase [Microbacter margulisiae]MBB3187516.1 SAM-dependent methyltransferase [Microbacter margulisiae]